ncbi:MAG: DUF2652 domain-containing protein [Proteobacteria bacterium]|nr:DUF2652 domain-containing protein [Pseudomonadota bacterium]
MNENPTKNVLLIIADISGYTEFMLSSKMEIEHSQKIISALINTIIEQIKMPLEVSKIEGDAVFLYAIKSEEVAEWDKVRKLIGDKLIQFFDVFREKLSTLGQSASCSCGACSHIDILKLKILVHSGEALFYSIQQFSELSGKDVILIHRLTKNSVPHDEYILLTEAAIADIEFPEQFDTEEGSEKYEHFDKIKTRVYLPA